MRTLCIAPCGATKIWKKYPNAGPTPARKVYIGSFASTCRRYAEFFYPDSYMILSAKHGLLAPNDIIPGDYDVSFNRPETNPITVDQLIIQRDQKRLADYECIIALGGKRYVAMLVEVFIVRKIINPLDRCRGNGEMMSVMIQAIQRNKPLASC